MLHSVCSLLVALSACPLDPPASSETLGVLLELLQVHRFDPARLELSRLSELFGALPPLSLAETPFGASLKEEIAMRITHLEPAKLQANIEQMAATPALAPVVALFRERQLAMADQITADIATAKDEGSLVRLMVRRPLSRSNEL